MKKNIKKLIKKVKKIDILFFIIAIFLFGLSFFTDKNMFDFKNLNIFNYVCVKVIYLILLIFVFQFLAKAKNGNKNARMYLKYFIIYMIPVIIFWILSWPGFFFGDDVANFYRLSTQGEFLYYLNYLSSIFYMLGYMAFPCVCGAAILLSCCFGILFSYLFKNLKDLFNNKYIYLILIPFLMFHVICYITFANRPIMYGVFYSFLISYLVIESLKKSHLNFKKYVFISFLAALVGFWRSEAIYLIIAVPVFMFIIYKIKISLRNVIKIFGLCFIFFILISLPQKIHDRSAVTEGPHSRNLPILISPLSVMLTEDLKGDNLEEDIENIDGVLDVESMIEYSSFYDTPCVWNTPSCMKTYDEEDFSKFIKSSINIIKNNPLLFLKAKSLTFIGATAVGGDCFSTVDSLLSNDATFRGIKGTSTILNYKIRNTIYSVLEGRTGIGVIDTIVHSTNSLFIVIIFLIFMFINNFRSKKSLYFLISSMLIVHIIILFFTEPAAYFMYHFNVYLTGFILYMIYNIERLSLKHVG